MCQTDSSILDRSYSNNQTLSVTDTIQRNNLTLRSRSSIHNKTTIRYASSSANSNGNTPTKDAETPIKKPKKVTTLSIAAMKRRGEKITMVTAYDFPSAVHVDRAGVDVLLVGDSCAMVELGFETTQVCTNQMMVSCFSLLSKCLFNVLLLFLLKSQ